MHDKLRYTVCVILYLILYSLPFTAKSGDGPYFPFPQHINYAQHTIKPNQFAQWQLDGHVRDYYNLWKGHYLVGAGNDTDGNPLFRIAHIPMDAAFTASEGQGYGMMIVAMMAGYDNDARSIFDGLYRFARLHPSKVDGRLMSWRVAEGIPPDESAFDGDADMAYGLMLANRQWGSTGQIDYWTAASNLINAIFESTIDSSTFLPLLGDNVKYDVSQYLKYTSRSSDFMAAHFKAFARFTGNNAWYEVVNQCHETIQWLQTTYSPDTGLLPDLVNNYAPAGSYFLDAEHDGDFGYDAGRVPMRLGMDVVLNNDGTSRAQLQKMSWWLQYAAEDDPNNIKAGYYLTGEPYGGDFFTTFFVSPFGVAAMADPNQQAWLNAIYQRVYNVHQEYYADSITLISLLVMTGNYWDPTTVE